MSAEDTSQRKLHELWLKLEKNTQDSFCTALWKWLVNSTKAKQSIENLHEHCTSSDMVSVHRPGVMAEV